MACETLRFRILHRCILANLMRTDAFAMGSIRNTHARSASHYAASAEPDSSDCDPDSHSNPNADVYTNANIRPCPNMDVCR